MRMQRFIIHCEGFGYLKPKDTGDLWYNEKDFVDTMEKAYWYKSKNVTLTKAAGIYAQRANEQAMTFENVEVIPIQVGIIDSDSGISGKDFMKAEYVTKKELYDYVQSLNEADTEAIPDAKWEEYVHAKNFVRDFGHFFETENA